MKKIILFSVLGFLLVIASVLGTLVLAKFLDEPLASTAKTTPEAADGQAEAAPVIAPAPLYVSLDSPFVVTFQAAQGPQFLQLTVDVAVEDASVEEAIAIHKSAIRNAMVMLLSSQQATELVTREGKERLREQVLEELQGILTKFTGKPGVTEVFFTSFLVQ